MGPEPDGQSPALSSLWLLHCSPSLCWLPGISVGKESAFSVGDLGSIHGLGRFPGKWNGYPLQYSCLEKSMDIGAWQTMVHGVTKSYT